MCAGKVNEMLNADCMSFVQPDTYKETPWQQLSHELVMHLLQNARLACACRAPAAVRLQDVVCGDIKVRIFLGLCQAWPHLSPGMGHTCGSLGLQPSSCRRRQVPCCHHCFIVSDNTAAA